MTALTQWLSASEQWLRDLGWWGVLLYAGFIIIVQFFMAPLSPFGVAAGFIFGLGRGFVAVEVGTLLGAVVNFFVSRYMARDFVTRRLARYPKLAVIDEAIGREGWKIVALLRFCPIPFGFANYAYGLCALRFWPYWGATALAILPGNLFFVYLGATAHAGLDAILTGGRARHPLEFLPLALGLVAAFCALLYVTKVARRALEAADPQLAEKVA